MQEFKTFCKNSTKLFTFATTNNKSMMNFQIEKAVQIQKSALFLFSMFMVLFSSAQDFEVAPTKLDFNCEPGQIQTKVVTIRNHSLVKQQFTLTLGDMQKDSTGKSTTKVDPNRSCKDWITINPSFFDLNSNESKEVKIVMQVPPGQNQTRWATIYVQPTEEQTSMTADKAMKTGIRVKPRIGIRVIQSPKSNTNYKADISDLKEITKPKDSLRTFEVKVTNTGDKLIEGKVYLILSDLATAKEIKAKPAKVSVLPDNKRMVKLVMPANIPPGKYSLAAILDYGNGSALEAVQMQIEVK